MTPFCRDFVETQKKDTQMVENGYIEHEAILDNMKAVKDELSSLRSQITNQVLSPCI